MTGSELSRLYQYDEWATNKLLEAADKLDTARHNKDLGTSFRSLLGTFVHIYGAQSIWLSRWNGQQPTTLVSVEQVPNMAELKARWQKLRGEFRDFLRSTTDEQLQKPFPYKDFKGNPWSELLYQQIHHVMLHSQYHRGQVVTLLRQLDQVPPQTDLIAYYRSGQ